MKTQLIARYVVNHDNPLLAAMPEMDIDNTPIEIFSNYPAPFVDRAYPLETKLLFINRIDRIIFPTIQYKNLLKLVNNLFKKAYSRRNPTNKAYVKFLNQKALLRNPLEDNQGRIAVICGEVGTGKSVALSRIMSIYPRVIRHVMFCGKRFYFDQVPWLKINTPFDGHVRALCLSIAGAVDNLLETSYRKNIATTDKDYQYICDQAARILTLHGLGLLIIEDIHILNSVGTKCRQEYLSFLNSLSRIGIAIMLVGSGDITRILEESDANPQIGQLIWEPISFSGEWHKFVQVLFSYSWHDMIDSENNELLPRILYEKSEGLPAIAKEIHKNCQYHMLANRGSNNEGLVNYIGRIGFRCERSIETDKKWPEKVDVSSEIKQVGYDASGDSCHQSC